MGTDLHHLPDLPHAGYSTRRQKETSDAIMFFMRGVERDRMLLLNIVVDGLDKWRKTAGTVWRGLLINRDVLDSIYHYFELQAGSKPMAQLVVLLNMQAQETQARWDKRSTTRLLFQRLQRQALKDLDREHTAARKGRKWFV